MDILLLISISFVAILFLLISKGDWKICAIAVYIALMVLIPGHVKIFSLSITGLLARVFFLLSLLLAIKYKEKSRFNYNVFKILIVYIGIHLIIMPFAGEIPVSLQLSSFKSLLISLMFTVFATVFICTKEGIYKLWYCIWILMLFVCLYGIYCYSTQSNLYMSAINIFYPNDQLSVYEGYIDSSRGGLTGRISSTIVSPVFYAGVLIIMFYIVLQGCLEFKKNNKKYILYIGGILLLILLFLNLFFTGTRSGLIALIIGLGYVFYQTTNIKTKLKFIILGIGVIALIGSGIKFNEYQEIIESTLFFWDEDKAGTEIRGSSTSMRLTQLEGTFDLIKGKSLLFGKGEGWVSLYITRNGMHPVLLGFESLIFQGLTEYGVIGFPLIYIIFFLMLFRLNKKYNSKENTSYNIVNGLLISYLIYALMTGAFYWGMFIAIFVIICKSYYILDSKQSERMAKYIHDK